MAVVFQAVGALATTISSQTCAVVAPTCQSDDILICCIINKVLAVAISAPDATWTQIYQADGDCTTAADDHRAAIFWKRAAQSDSGATFNFTKVSGTDLFAGVISAWRGCVGWGTPVDLTAVGATVTVGANDNVAFPAFDPTTGETQVLFVAFYGNDNTTFNAAMSADVNPDCTNRWDLETNSGNDCTIACTSGQSDGQNIASRTWASASTVDAGSTGVVFALVPPARTAFNNYLFVRTRGGISSNIG
jgi:hypothetical protein